MEVVRQLLDRGLDEQHRDNSGWTPLHYAAFEGKLMFLKNFPFSSYPEMYVNTTPEASPSMLQVFDKLTSELCGEIKKLEVIL